MSLRDDFFRLAPPTETIEVQGCKLTVRSMSLPDQFRFFALPDDQAERTAWLVVFCTVDEAGNRVFLDEDVPALKSYPCGVILPLAQAAARLSGFTSDDDELKKKSVTPTGLSYTV
jgi:hypothetical protein